MEPWYARTGRPFFRARIQLVIIPVKHFLNRIIKRMNPLTDALGKIFRRPQIVLRRKAAPALMTVIPLTGTARWEKIWRTAIPLREKRSSWENIP